MKENSNETENVVVNNEQTDVVGATDAVSELIKLTKKQLFFQRILAISMVGILVAIVVAAFVMIPKVTITLNHINSVAVKAEESLAKVDSMTEDISGSAKGFDRLMDDNAQQLTEAVTKISEIDFDGLNQAIKDLQDAIGPMANFMNRFR